MPVAGFDPSDLSDETMAFDVVKESGNAAAAAGASFGVLVGSLAPAPVLGPILGAAIGFGIGMVIGRAFARREGSGAVGHSHQAGHAAYSYSEDDLLF